MSLAAHGRGAGRRAPARRALLLAAALTVLVTLPGCSRPTKAPPGLTTVTAADRVLVLEPDARGKLKCGIALYDHFDIRPDPEGTLTIEDVASEAGAARFVPNRTREVPLGTRTGAVWVRLRVRSELAEPHAWWVFPGFWNVAELYTPDGTGFGVFRSGASHPPPEPGSRDPRLKFFHLKLLVPGGHREMTVYLRLADRLSSDPLASIEGSLHRELHQPALQKPERVVDLGPGLNGELRGVGLYEVSDLLVDPEGKLTIGDVTTEEIGRRFVRNRSYFEPLDVGSRTVWVRFRLRSDLPDDHVWWLYPRFWGVAELYLPEHGGYTVSRSGAFVAPYERSAPEANLRLYFLKLPIPAGPQEITAYLRLHADLYLGPDRAVIPSLEPELKPGWRRPESGAVFLQAVTLGMLGALGLYHVVLFVRVRERCYLLFGLALLGRGLLVAADSRVLLEFVWPQSASWDFHFRLFQGPLWVVPFFMFFTAFLGTREHAPRLHRALNLLLIPSLAEPLLTWLRPTWYGPVLNLQYLVWAVVPIVVALGALRRHSKEALIFLAANPIMLVYSISQSLNQTGLRVDLPQWGALVGEMAAAVLFSVAVAEHIRRLRREKERARGEEAQAELLLKRRELEAVLLRGELSEVRLRVLRNQLQPHFLFNTLNSISALMHLDLAEAEHKLTLLADLLRLALVERSGNEVLLRDEVDFVSRYLEIEKTRFPQRLAVVWETAPNTLDALVPHLVLQPLAENAVRHGIAPRSRRGTVRIRSWREDDTLHLEVCDDGVGPTSRSSPREGVGLSNTRARLYHLYGEGGQLRLGEAEGGGFVASVTLPFHTVEQSRGAQAGPDGSGAP